MTVSRYNSFHSYLNAEIKFKRTDGIMLILTFGSAMVDTMTLPTLSVFVANNTGNLLFLGLGVVGVGERYPGLIYTDRALLALIGSWFGSILTGRIGRWCSTTKRYWIFLELAFESILIFISALLLYTGAVTLDGKTNLVIVFLLGWAFGSQSVCTKFFGIPTIQVQVVTGAMGDLFSDPNLFVGITKNKARNQRAIFVCTFFVGAMIGGLILLRTTPEFVLIITGIFKLLGALAFLVVPAYVKESNMVELEKVLVSDVKESTVVATETEIKL